MKLGIVSDSHDNIPKIKAMVTIVNDHNVELLLHAGDFISPFALNPLADLHCPWYGVFGNNDGEKEGLKKKSNNHITDSPFYYNVGDLRVALMHQRRPITADIVVYGHTHIPAIEQDAQLFINPGEVCGYLTDKSSLVILDTDTLKHKLIFF